MAATANPRRTPAGSKHADLPVDFWRLRGPDLQFGRERFQMLWVPQHDPPRNITDHVESVTWTDDPETMLTGELHVRDSSDVLVPIQQGDQIVLYYALTGQSNFVELWRMLVNQPFVSQPDATRVFQLETGLALLALSTDDFNFSVGTIRPKGWRAFEIAAAIAARYRVPVGTIAETSHYIKRLLGFQTSPLEIIGKAYTREKNYTHRRFTISMDHGQLNITPLRRSPTLLQLGPTLIAASLQATRRDDFATAVTIRSHTVISKGKDKKGILRQSLTKVYVELPSQTAEKKFGYVHKDVWAHDANSVAALKAAAQRHLALAAKPVLESTITHPGLPMVKRGQAVQVLLAEDAYQQIVFVVRAAHTLTGNDYRLECQLGFQDPFVDAKVDRVDESNALTAREQARLAKKLLPKAKKIPKHTDLTPGGRLGRRAGQVH